MRTPADPYQRELPARLWIVPLAATVAGSLTALLPLVAGMALLPPFGLMMALAWRLRRPEMWPAWIALPLGLIDDLLSGAALGTAMCLWTATFLVIEIADHRPMWRDHWLDWALAGLALQFCALGGWASAALTGGGGGSGPWLTVPQTIFAILCFPIVARLCARLDAWRLRA